MLNNFSQILSYHNYKQHINILYVFRAHQVPLERKVQKDHKENKAQEGQEENQDHLTSSYCLWQIYDMTSEICRRKFLMEMGKNKFPHLNIKDFATIKFF